MRSVLIIDDDESLLTILKHNFKKELNIAFTYCQNYQNALELFDKKYFDIYIIDLNLDGHSGMKLLRILQKEKNIDNRVILFSSETNSEIKIQGYNLGASNFVEKPLDIDLLRAIIKRNLRVLDTEMSTTLQFENIIINPDLRNCLMIIRGKKVEINLTLTEFNICYELINSPQRVVSKDHLSYLGKDRNKAMSYKALEMHISSLKKKLGHKDLIKSVRGVGYLLNSFKNDHWDL